MRLAALGLLFLVLPIAADACRTPPSHQTEFSRQSFTTLPECSERGQPCITSGITAAWYALPTDRYRHGVLGDAIEGGKLGVYTDRQPDSCGARYLILDDAHVFEDVAPRLVDLDHDGDVEVITVRTHREKGAQLAIWDDEGDGNPLRLVATTPYIGQSNRWLAPLGAADLDGDGAIEIAYVDRPHLAKTLRIWRYTDERLTEIARIAGVTNHRIGEEDIAGGIRDCGAGAEMVLASANWRDLLALKLDGSDITVRKIGNDTSRGAFAAAMRCET